LLEKTSINHCKKNMFAKINYLIDNAGWFKNLRFFPNSETTARAKKIGAVKIGWNLIALVLFCGVGYRHIRLLSNTGEPLENSILFVHIAITNKKGGGVSLVSLFFSSHFSTHARTRPTLAARVPFLRICTLTAARALLLICALARSLSFAETEEIKVGEGAHRHQNRRTETS
jgi:hypothetical protein